MLVIESVEGSDAELVMPRERDVSRTDAILSIRYVKHTDGVI